MVKAKTIRWVLISGFVVCAAMVAAVAYLLHDGVTVTVHNATGATLSHLMSLVQHSDGAERGKRPQ